MATAVVYSGPVATASAMVNCGAPPNLAGYQVCMVAWFFASHGGSGQAATSQRVARSSLSRLRSAGSRKTTSTSRADDGLKPSP